MNTTFSRRIVLKAALSALPLLALAPPFSFAAGADGKTLVLFFSHTGNTLRIAEMVHQRVGGDLVELKTLTPYPQNHDAVVAQAKAELNADFRPEISTRLDNLADYDRVFIGYPNWWGTLPMAFFTLLEQYDMGEKTIAPFTTHEGTRFGGSLSDLKRLCPNATILDGFETRGLQVASAGKDMDAWLQSLAGKAA